MSDESHVKINARQIPFGYGLSLQTILQMGEYMSLMKNAPMKEISMPATSFMHELADAASECMKEYVKKNHPNATGVALLEEDGLDVAKDSLDEIIKKGSK